MQKQDKADVSGVRKWTLLAIAACGIALVWGVSVLVPSPADQAFAWFDQLGFPNVKGCKFVRVSTGAWRQIGNAQPQNSYIEGFLLAASNQSFTVFTKDLLVQTFHASTSNTPAYKTVGFEILDIAKSLTAYLDPTNTPEEWPGFSGQQLPPTVQDFVLAWGCEKNGFHGLARRLYEKAAEDKRQTTPAKSNYWIRAREFVTGIFKKSGKKRSFIDEMEEQFGNAIMWRTVLAFDNPKISRAEILDQFEDLIRKYPHCKHVPRARESVAILRRMLREDQTHALKAAKTFGELPITEKVAELIYQLRDQNGKQFSQPGSCDIFNDSGGSNSPAAQLERLGFTAVPQLIEVIGTNGFTRCVGYHRNFYFSHYVLTVGEGAVAILDRIAGRTFETATHHASKTSPGPEFLPVKAAAQAWWSDLQQRGEKAVLVDGTERGDDDSPEQAMLLVKRFPNESPRSIERGARAATNSWVRTRLVELASSPQFLVEEASSALSLSTRLAAAKRLWKQGNDAGLRAMIEEWKGMASSKSSDAWDLDALVTFLANSGGVQAVEALGNGLKARPIAQRWCVIWTLADAWNDFELASSPADLNATPPNNRDKEFLGAIERLLTSELADTDQYIGLSGSSGDTSYSDPRMCDGAAYGLSRRWPKKYVFDLAAREKVREQQRIACLNVWNTENGLPSIPLPERRRLPEFDAGRVRLLIDKLREAKTHAERVSAIQSLERLGPCALPEIRKNLNAISNPKMPASDLEAMQRRLACIVTEIKFDREGAAWDAGVGTALSRMTNAPVTAEGLIGVSLAVAKGWRSHRMGIVVKASRDEDFTGVSLRINIKTNRVFQAGTQKGWDYSERVTVGNDDVYRSGGMSSVEYGATRECYNDFILAIAKAIDSPPEVPFTISFSLLREE